jgi:hypothetical protein
MKATQSPSPYLFQMQLRTRPQAGTSSGHRAGASESNKPETPANWFQHLWKGANTGASAANKAPERQHPEADLGGKGRIGRSDPKAVQKRQEIAAERTAQADVGKDGSVKPGERRAAVPPELAFGLPSRLRL